MLRLAAEVTQKSLTDFVLDAASQGAEQPLLDQRLFMVSGSQYQALLDLLEQRERDNAGVGRFVCPSRAEAQDKRVFDVLAAPADATATLIGADGFVFADQPLSALQLPQFGIGGNSPGLAAGDCRLQIAGGDGQGYSLKLLKGEAVLALVSLELSRFKSVAIDARAGKVYTLPSTVLGNSLYRSWLTDPNGNPVTPASTEFIAPKDGRYLLAFLQTRSSFRPSRCPCHSHQTGPSIIG